MGYKARPLTPRPPPPISMGSPVPPRPPRLEEGRVVAYRYVAARRTQPRHRWRPHPYGTPDRGGLLQRALGAIIGHGYRCESCGYSATLDGAQKSWARGDTCPNRKEGPEPHTGHVWVSVPPNAYPANMVCNKCGAECDEEFWEIYPDFTIQPCKGEKLVAACCAPHGDGKEICGSK